MVTLNSLGVKFRSQFQSRISGVLHEANAKVRDIKEERFDIAPDEYTYDALLTQEQASNLIESGYGVEFYF